MALASPPVFNMAKGDRVMKKNEVKVGGQYLAKVSDKVVTVRIDAENPRGGWDATNMTTKKQVRIKSAQRLRGHAKGGDATPAATTGNAAAPPTPPLPKALAVHVEHDREKDRWFWSIREGKVEHHQHPDGLSAENKAQAAGDKWLAKYAKANAGGRRKMLGWKANDAAHAATDDKAATATTTTAGGDTGERRARGAKKEPKAKRVSGLDAAAQVLKDAGKPMKCADIVETMLSKRMWKTGGKTPAATIYAAILREINVKKNESRFKKTDRGLFEYHAPANAA